MVHLLKEIGVGGGEAGILTLLLGKMLWDKINSKNNSSSSEKIIERIEESTKNMSERIEKQVDRMSNVTTDHKIMLGEFKSVVSGFKTVMQANTQVLQALVTKITNS